MSIKIVHYCLIMTIMLMNYNTPQTNMTLTFELKRTNKYYNSLTSWSWNSKTNCNLYSTMYI